MNRAGWSALAVLTPLTAAAFAGTTWWASAHDPRANPTSVSVDQMPVSSAQVLPSTDSTPQEEAEQEVVGLRERIAKVRARTVEVLQQAEQIILDQGAVEEDVETGQSNATSWQSAPQPAPQPVPAPAPAPPADTTTGAS